MQRPSHRSTRIEPLARGGSLAAVAAWLAVAAAGCGAPARSADAATPGQAGNPASLSYVAALPDAAVADAARAGRGDPRLFGLADVFELEWASDPRIAPDGRNVVYVRNFMDIMTDRRRANLWIVSTGGTDHRPLTSGNGNVGSPRWSPDGKRLLYVAGTGGRRGPAQLHVRWMDTGQSAKITNLTGQPQNVTWSPDGRWIAFGMRVPARQKPLAAMPEKPKGAEWAAPARVIDKMTYRIDGLGYVEDGFVHAFVVPSEGGTPRQLTSGDVHHGGAPSWTPDSASIILAANRRPDWEYEPLDSELYEVAVTTGAIRALTDRRGPDGNPVVSPDGRRVAYLGFDDTRQSFRASRLYVLDRESGTTRPLLADFDHTVSSPVWSPDGRGLYFMYDDRGNGKLAYAPLAGGKHQVIAGDVGGQSIGRPYGGGSFTVAKNRAVAYTRTRPEHPADVYVVSPGDEPRRLTDLNRDLLGHKQLAQIEAIEFESSHDQRVIQGWILEPPGFDPNKKYPLVLEIHGGPFANYGDRFTAECQLYAAAGYVVLYVNPRGSSSYGEAFANSIHHAYPGHDYDDLMSGVDHVLARGYVDPKALFVTGGSGGGVLTSWIVGKTDRFRAAVVVKPVINWYSFVLTADFAALFTGYWFPGPPWDFPEHYLARSPLSLVGKVTTPTMVLSGESDYRTPMSESEQYYQALRLRKVETVLVRIPGASHHIAARPSQLIAKVAYILAWFEKHRIPPASP